MAGQPPAEQLPDEEALDAGAEAQEPGQVGDVGVEEEEFHMAEEAFPEDEVNDGDEEFEIDQPELGDDLDLEQDSDDEDEEDDGDGADGDENAAAPEGRPHLLNLLLALWPQAGAGAAAADAELEAAADANAPDLVNFDRDLPGEHAYLGGDLESPASAATGRTVLEEGTVVELPTLTCSLGVLLPGQLLPVALFHPSDVALVSSMSAGRIGPVAVLRHYRYGSTAELLSCKEESDDNVGITMIRAKLIGRQRFEALSLRRDIAGRLWAKVRLLPEPKELSPSPMRPGPRRSIHLAGCPFPVWVADGYDSRQLVAAIRGELAAWNRSWAAVQAGPDDPTAFAYWLLEQLPLPDWLRADLLGCPHPAGCLRRCLALLRRCSALRCARCRSRITEKAAIFCLAASGSTGAYVNPGGHVHEMMTVASAQGLRRVGRPSLDHSWFPGYAWQVLECEVCSQHMGWRFTAESPDARPAAFYGLCRTSLQPDLTPRAAPAADTAAADAEDAGELPELVVQARISLRPLLGDARRVGDASGGSFGDWD